MSIVATGRIRGSTSDDSLAPCQFSHWCGSRGKRALDVFIAGTLVALALPVLVVIAVLVRLSSPGPVLFRQKRAGRGGREFQLLKFRTMCHDTTGPGVTQAGDSRITRVGHWLRTCKLDELPQLWNVVRGEMSLVGPRPDLMEYWRRVDAPQLRVLELLPGITGPATLEFRREEDYLKDVPPQRLTDFYCENLLPRKVDLELQYAISASLLTDIKIIARTALALLIGVG